MTIGPDEAPYLLLVGLTLITVGALWGRDHRHHRKDRR
jgi:hypothetical protein